MKSAGTLPGARIPSAHYKPGKKHSCSTATACVGMVVPSPIEVIFADPGLLHFTFQLPRFFSAFKSTQAHLCRTDHRWGHRMTIAGIHHHRHRHHRLGTPLALNNQVAVANSQNAAPTNGTAQSGSTSASSNSSTISTISTTASTQGTAPTPQPNTTGQQSVDIKI